MRLFGEEHITRIFQQNVNRMLDVVRRLGDSQLLSEDKSQIVGRIYRSFEEQPISIDFTKREASIDMVNKQGRSFPAGTDVISDKLYPVACVTYTFSNNSSSSKFLSAVPVHNVLQMPVNADVDDAHIRLSYITNYARTPLSDDVSKKVKNWISSILPQLEQTVEFINSDIAKYNAELIIHIDKFVTEKIEAAKQKKQAEDDLADF